jgi:cysteine-rich repeat protein
MIKHLGIVLFAASALGALPPYDFTGHWGGTLAIPGFPVVLDGELTSTGPKTFTGTLMAMSSNGTVPCDVHGRRKRKVRLRALCADGTRVRGAGALDSVLDTITGTARVSKRGRRVTASITLLKEHPGQTTTTTEPGGTTTTTVFGTACGNGTVDPGEQCDDGNQVGGDGCSASCAIERSVVEVEPNGAAQVATDVGTPPVIALGAVQPAGDLDFFSFVVGASGSITLETLDGNGSSNCDASTDTYLELRNPSNVIISENDDIGLSRCSKIQESGLAPGVYFACVRGPYGTTVVPAYQLLIRSP